MKMSEVLKMHFESPGTQSTSPGPRSADDWIRKYLDDKETRQNNMRQMAQRYLDAKPKKVSTTDDLEAVNFVGLPKENFIEKAAEGGRYAVVNSQGLLLGTYHNMADAETAARAKIEPTKIIDLGMDQDGRPNGSLGEKPDVLNVADALRMRNIRAPHF